MNKYLTLFFRIVVGAIFLWASLDKIIDPAKFARDISNYHIVPLGLENTIALILPWLEFFIGTGLIIGVMVDGSIIISSVLLITFNIMIAQAMARGVNIDCGCGLKEGQLVGFEKLIENFIFILFSYFVFVRKEKFLEFFPKTELSDK